MEISILTPGRKPDFPEDRLDALGPAFVRFSSGTTGASKGVVLSHRTLTERIGSANRRLRITPGDRILWTLSMAHHFAVSILLYLSRGACTVIADSPLAEDWLTAALESGATVAYGSPFQHAQLAAENSGRCWPSLRLAVSTAAPLTENIARAFRQRFGIPLTQGLGLIEAGLPLLNTVSNDPLNVGAPDDFDIALLDSVGRASDEGELALRGPGMFDAYLTPWKERAEVMADGWFHTGDLAHGNPDGSLKIVGRLKSAINVAGMKCFPEEVEAVLLTHPGVREVRVAAEKNERCGMVPIAEIVPVDPESPPSAASLRAHCRSALASPKIPARYLFVASIAKTPSGKILR